MYFIYLIHMMYINTSKRCVGIVMNTTAQADLKIALRQNKKWVSSFPSSKASHPASCFSKACHRGDPRDSMPILKTLLFASAFDLWKPPFWISFFMKIRRSLYAVFPLPDSEEDWFGNVILQYISNKVSKLLFLKWIFWKSLYYSRT